MIAGLRGLPRMLKKRRIVQAQRKLSDVDIEALLSE